MQFDSSIGMYATTRYKLFTGILHMTNTFWVYPNFDIGLSLWIRHPCVVWRSFHIFDTFDYDRSICYKINCHRLIVLYGTLWINFSTILINWNKRKNIVYCWTNRKNRFHLWFYKLILKWEITKIHNAEPQK